MVSKMSGHPFRCGLGFRLCLIVLVACAAASGEEPKKKEVAFGEALILPPAGRGGRVPIPIDPVNAQMASGTWQRPKAGDKIAVANGKSLTWSKLSVGKDGNYESPALTGGRALFLIPSDEDRVMVLEASGHTMSWVNGEPRIGDPYSHGYVRVPVALKKGTNEFLFTVGRGELRAKLTTPSSTLFFNPADATVPDLIAGQKYEGWVALPVINATPTWQSGIVVETTLPGAQSQRTNLPALPPLSVSKVPFQIVGPSSAKGETIVAQLELQQPNGTVNRSLNKAEIRLRVLKPEQTHKCTFRSRIDGSVQYYAVVPASPGKEMPTKQTPGLTLTLHGAGVEGLGQAACFTPKPWTHVVAATNRRQYGFDWEDWGRLDALEVLDEAMHALKPDPLRVWLTGHSMGGHGTWHLGVTYPDKFAGIGPSAGWISMMSYAGASRPEHADAMANLFARAASPSDTLALVKNLAALGVYILHGDQDDNVPVEQAREMRKVLGGFHTDWAYHERTGAGHWWGNLCVDWPQMFEFFSERSLPREGDVKQIDFTTASPEVSAQCHWAVIEQQQKAFKPSSIQMTHEPDKRAFAGKTENVACLAINVRHLKPGTPVRVKLDGQKLGDAPWPNDGEKIWLYRTGDKWQVGEKLAITAKSPTRGGPFRDVFRNHVLLVIGTHGSPAENDWALQKARFDAESFWYRGNGFLEIVTDTSFDAAKEHDRNVVLYGNADTNAAWAALLGDSPVQVKSGLVKLGDHETKGDDLGCIFVRPRPGSDVAAVGAVAGTGIKGMRLTDRLPYFVSGIAYPDCVLLGSEVWTKGLSGVKAAGFFGNDWTIEHGEFVWH
jgi:pimeloyl-ACP methyl ester carboxylesterase